MGKSGAVQAAEAKIRKIDAKLEELETVSKTLSSCKTKVKKTYNDKDSDHVKGDKYDEHYESAQEVLETASAGLSSLKSEVKLSIATNVAQLQAMRVAAVAELVIAKAMGD